MKPFEWPKSSNNNFKDFSIFVQKLIKLNLIVELLNYRCIHLFDIIYSKNKLVTLLCEQ